MQKKLPRPLHSKVLLKIVKTAQLSQSLIIIPESVKQKDNVGIVEVVSSKIDKLITPGEVVTYSNDQGDELVIDGEFYLLIDLRHVTVV